MADEIIKADRLWSSLRAATSARIGLNSSGRAISTKDHLAFQLAHAEARDAVNEPFDATHIAGVLEQRGLQANVLCSQAADRQTYLVRPDLGRSLNETSRERLMSLAYKASDLVFVIADGLSARAVKMHALPLLDLMVPAFRDAGWTLGPVSIVEQGRVAIGDEIGELCKASAVAMLIGERPGLSSSDSLGIYLTWAPQVGRTDAERNCLSNIRDGGMTYVGALNRLIYLCNEARKKGFTGVNLKDDMLQNIDSAPALSKNSTD